MRAQWTVITRVTAESAWCVYGPMTHREALGFARLKVGTNIECHVALLLSPPRSANELKNPLRTLTK